MRGKEAMSDPHQVKKEDCTRLKFIMLRGHGMQDSRFDTPDCYVVIDVPKSLEKTQQTRSVTNSLNPIWNEEICFHIPPDVTTADAMMNLMNENLVKSLSTAMGSCAIKDITGTGMKDDVVKNDIIRKNFGKNQEIEFKIKLELPKTKPEKPSSAFLNAKSLTRLWRLSSSGSLVNSEDGGVTETDGEELPVTEEDGGPEDATFYRTAKQIILLNRFLRQVSSQHCCHQLNVKIIRARNIHQSSIWDLVDVPDVYVEMAIPAAARPMRRTRCIDNDYNPIWDETFTFYLPSEEAIVNASIKLKDEDVLSDDLLDTAEITFDVNVGETKIKTIEFNQQCTLDIEYSREICSNKDHRYSFDLCDEEKAFLTKRREKVHMAMNKLLGDQGPKTLQQTPTVAVIGSGGGHRAMMGFAGAMKALKETGILDCATYIAGLSGSTWYMSSLFTNPNFPNDADWVDHVNDELRQNVQLSVWTLPMREPGTLGRFWNIMREKQALGQPISLTDFYGLMVAETLLGKSKMNTKMSTFKDKISDGEAPFPIYTAIHVKPKVSALNFSEWLELTPHEIGMAKYGTFIKTPKFGSQFVNGKLIKDFEELPLHYYMGVCGSAFTFVLDRTRELVLGDNGNEKDIREMTNKYIEEAETVTHHHDIPANNNDDTPSSNGVTEEDGTDGQSTYDRILSSASNMFGRAFRAGKIHNFLKGESFVNDLITDQEERKREVLEKLGVVRNDDEMMMLDEVLDVQREDVYLVDAGLSFNSPFPAVLRLPRGVNLILSFDFSLRSTENGNPFEELLLAEKWAAMNRIPFPRIDTSVHDENNPKECYVFHDKGSRKTPIVMHFVLGNFSYRESGDSSRDFQVFGEGSAYGTFNMEYTANAFDDITKLMEYNVLINKEIIMENMRACINKLT